jgi:hypothetical protein
MSGLTTVTAREETGLSIREEHGRELSMARQAAQAQHEVQSAITVAIKFPRNEDDSFGRLMKACSREAFALKAAYSFPRGGTKVIGPSSHLAREAARVWGNIQYGFEIVRDDDENIHLRGWAWDMQTNSKATQDAHFRKAVQRKVQGQTKWIKPDERDLRELINKHGAIAERNCVLKILPADLIEEAMATAFQTIERGVSKDIDGERKKMVAAFAQINVSVPELEAYLGNPLKHANPAQVTELRTIWRSIMDGNSTWTEYVEKDSKAPPANVKQEATVDDLLGGPTVDDVAAVQSILDEINAAVNVGDLAAIRRLYDQHCGPESTLTNAQMAPIDQTCKLAIRRLENPPATKKGSKAAQGQLLDTAPNTGA